MTSALFSALFFCLSYRNTKSGNKMHMTILISPTFSQKLTFTVMSNNSVCIVWNCNPIWPVWDGFKMFYSSNKYKNFVSWCQFRSHCFIGAPDVTWFTSHWLPSLILPTAVVILPSCGLLVLPDASPSPPKLLQHPSHLLHSFSCSCGFLSSHLPLSSDIFFFMKIDTGTAIKSPDGWNDQKSQRKKIQRPP